MKPESFYKPAHRYIYEAMLQLFNSNERIDIVSVSNVLDYSQKLETVGGRPFINDLALNAISTANIEYYSKIIQEKAIKRALINAGSEILDTTLIPLTSRLNRLKNSFLILLLKRPQPTLFM